MNTETHVSNKFIDEYMVEANGEFVKIYLYLLRRLGSVENNFSISDIADRLNHTEADTIRAIKYWEKQGLIAVEYGANDVITGLEMISPETPAIINAVQMNPLSSDMLSTPANTVSKDSSPVLNTPAYSISQVNPQASSAQASQINSQASSAQASQTSLSAVAGSVGNNTINKAETKKEYTLDEIKNFKNDPEISELFFILEVYLKRPLSSSDTNTILYWYDELHFTSDLIIHLVEYCLSKNHSSIKYMDKVAINWAEHNITTVEQAKENSAAHSQIYYAVMKALGISGRNLVSSEMDFLNKWTKVYLFDNEIIEEACKRTITAIHQPSFEYTDTILTNWHKNQVHTLNDVKRLDEIFSKNKKVTVNTADTPTVKRNKFNNFNQRNHDFDQLEKVLLTTSVQ
ncbi:MAG: DnaD domain protein [Agathobacter sp.]|nr:DnaD domain protein [Agathobacter sp.]